MEKTIALLESKRKELFKEADAVYSKLLTAESPAEKGRLNDKLSHLNDSIKFFEDELFALDSAQRIIEKYKKEVRI